MVNHNYSSMSTTGMLSIDCCGYDTAVEPGARFTSTCYYLLQDGEVSVLLNVKLNGSHVPPINE